MRFQPVSRSPIVVAVVLLLLAALPATLADSALDATVTIESSPGRWTARVLTPGASADVLGGLDLAPGGNRAFLAVRSDRSSSPATLGLFAFDVEARALLWEARGDVLPVAVAASPDGSRVAVAGLYTTGILSNGDDVDAAVAVFDAATGELEWRWRGPVGPSRDHARALAWSHDGASLYAAGIFSVSSAGAALVAAFDAATGAVRWSVAYDATPRFDAASAVAVAPSGLVLVAGVAETGINSQADSFLAGFDPATGARAFTVFRGAQAPSVYRPFLTVSPDGVAFVAGVNRMTGMDFLTTAHDAATGAELWRATYSGSSTVEIPQGIALTADGTRVVVAGYAGSLSSAVVTLSYDAATGALAWASAEGDRVMNVAHALAIGPSGEIVVAGAGTSVESDALLLALDPTTGARVCRGYYDSTVTGASRDIARSLRVAGSGAYLGVEVGSRAALVAYPPPAARAAAMPVRVTIAGEAVPLLAASANASGTESSQASERAIALPEGLGEVRLADAAAWSRATFGCAGGDADADSVATVARATLLGGAIVAEGIVGRATAAIWSAPEGSARSDGTTIARLEILGEPREAGVPLSVALPLGLGEVSALDARLASGTVSADARVDALRVTTTLPDGRVAVIALGRAEASVERAIPVA